MIGEEILLDDKLQQRHHFGLIMYENNKGDAVIFVPYSFTTAGYITTARFLERAGTMRKFYCNYYDVFTKVDREHQTQLKHMLAKSSQFIDESVIPAQNLYVSLPNA